MKIYNRITLAFPKEKEKTYLEQYFADSLSQVRISLLLGSFLYGIFAFLDRMLFPDFAQMFFIIRFFIVIPFLISLLAFSFTKIFRKYWQISLFITSILGGVGVIIMSLVEPENYAYYAGLLLVLFAIYFFMKQRFFIASLAGWTLILIYNIGAIFFSDSPSFTIINANFFLISANFIGMFGAYNIEYFLRRNYHLNHELIKEKTRFETSNADLEKTVSERTKELRLAKEAAETENANILAILEGTTSSIWAFNANYDILYINRRFQTEFEQAFGVLLQPGVNLVQSLPEMIRPTWEPRYDRVLRGEQFSVEDVVEGANGLIYIEILFNPIVKKGVVVGGSCFGSNITDRKLSEIELQKAKERAEESEKLKSAFLANMSHEIRTPLNGIMGFSEMLKEPDLSLEEQLEFATIIGRNGERMFNIINDIIGISKIESGEINLFLSDLNINEEIEQVYALFKPEADCKQLHFSYKNGLSLSDAVLETDHEKFVAILSHLIKNALKYTENGLVEFGYLRKDEYFEFYVKDTGIGIGSATKEVIFERFIQADTSNKRVYQGAGLGLSISKAYVEMLEGQIWVESEVGVGSTFYFTLPCKRN